MGYRRRLLSLDPPSLAVPSSAALRQIEPVGPHTAQLALDTMITGPRVVAELGLQGAQAFTIPAADNPTYNPGMRKYPIAEAERVALRISGLELTPGHLLALQVLALPSGPTQTSPSAGSYEEDGRGGTIELRVTYDNGTDQVTAVAQLSPPASGEVWGAEPASAHDGLVPLEDTAKPWELLPSAADLEKWTARKVTCSIKVTYQGSVRPIDVAIVEVPAQIVVDTASSSWPTNAYTDAGQPYAELPSDYPITQLTGTDPGGGLEAIRRALEAHGQRLGPCLAWWTSALEQAGKLANWISYDGGTGDDEAPAWVTSSTSPVQVGTDGPIAFEAEFPGWLLGGYARRSSASDEFLDGRTGVLPVWLVVYPSSTDGRLSLRCGANAWQTIEVALVGGVFDFAIVPGWAEVGVGPEDGPVGRLFAWSPTGVNVLVRYAALFYRQS